jgi:hypothetical protein
MTLHSCAHHVEGMTNYPMKIRMTILSTEWKVVVRVEPAEHIRAPQFKFNISSLSAPIFMLYLRCSACAEAFLSCRVSNFSLKLRLLLPDLVSLSSQLP